MTPDFETYLKLNEEEMIGALQELLRVNTEAAAPVRTKDGQLYPYGAGNQECLEKALELGRKLGFVTRNVDNYGGHIDWPGTGKPVLDEAGNVTAHEAPKIMAVLGHLDVVPAGDGWDFDPYGAEVKDGYIYGRGTTDDKGPVISCLYAMKALKDAGYQPKNTIRLILGLDEETGSSGMDYYFSKEQRPDFGFTPDADFPIINGEKGILTFELAKKFQKTQAGSKGLELRSLTGGTAPNSVPDRCRAVVRSEVAGAYDKIKERAAAWRELTGHKIACKGMGKSLELVVTGLAAHGAHRLFLGVCCQLLGIARMAQKISGLLHKQRATHVRNFADARVTQADLLKPPLMFLLILLADVRIFLMQQADDFTARHALFSFTSSLFIQSNR